MRKLATTCLAIGIVLAITSMANADATSYSWAVLDWSSLTIDYTGGSLNWGLQLSDSWAEAEDNNTSKDEDAFLGFGWGNTLAQASVPGAYGDAWTTTGTEVGVEVSADTIGGLLWAESSSRAGYVGDFTADGDGTLTVSINYELLQNLNTEVLGDFAEGEAAVHLFVDNWGTGVSVIDHVEHRVEMFNCVLDGDSFYNYMSGTLWVSMDFSDGDSGFFTATSECYAYVTPAPGAVLLGILGLSAAGIKLRKFV